MKNQSSAITIGLDLGDRKHALCVLDAKGEILKQEGEFHGESLSSTRRGCETDLGLRWRRVGIPACSIRSTGVILTAANPNPKP